ncbi:uncharacterized protein LOC118420121 [Branchiostoma floridae]|uniref:Uncharacterized protein LOC118420121 n=1 Tax=Branchiostoma floridae TaxID=7739 RepID=A0A9J7LH20_BRAFL|nr:uncharacterized protein LOC118420121 [Branchiostoma floridae]
METNDDGQKEGRITVLSRRQRELQNQHGAGSSRNEEMHDQAGTSRKRPLSPVTKPHSKRTASESELSSVEVSVGEGSMDIPSREDEREDDRHSVEEQSLDDDDDDSGADPGSLFKIREIRQRRVQKFNTNQVTMTAIPNYQVDLSEHDTIMQFLNGMFESMIHHVDKELKDDDKMRLVLNSDRLDRPVSTKMVNRSEMEPELLLGELERTLQSHKDFVIDDSFFVDLLTVQFPEKGSGRWRFFCNIEKFVQNKQCIIQIKNRDDLCCGRALVVAMNYLQKNDPNVRWNSIRQGCKLQTVLAQELYQSAEVPQGPCGLPEIQKFQEHLTDYQIIVVSAKELNEVVFKGPHHEQKLILY